MRNRNIFTNADIEELKSLQEESDTDPKPEVPSSDDFFDRLLMYIPIEIIGGYLIIESLLESMLKKNLDVIPKILEYSLLGLLILGLIGTFTYLKYNLKIVRPLQIVMSLLAFAIWVLYSGGWFEVTFSFWQVGWGTIGVVIFAITVGIMKLPPIDKDVIKKIFKIEIRENNLARKGQSSN